VVQFLYDEVGSEGCQDDLALLIQPNNQTGIIPKAIERMDGKGKQNRVAEIRKQRMMSKAELARAAGISPLTIDRLERGYDCRMDTKRKIIKALGLDLSQAALVFPEAAEPAPPVAAVPDEPPPVSIEQPSLFSEDELAGAPSKEKKIPTPTNLTAGQTPGDIK
jgi:DNA-binding XRE family transcriptional regulator